MTVADASVLVAHLHHQDRFHQQSTAWIAQHLLNGGEIVGPRLVLAEVAGAIARRTGDPALGHAAVQQLLVIPRVRLVPVTDELADYAATLAAELRLKGADAVYLAVAAEFGMPLVTWDQEQRTRGAQLVITSTPNGP
ncbi:MAG TPA: type II toxin-antitoxin system VapC family toxin [Herpetosiphonaceae bacterium]|nr:type II toxin-antitoxin system VapC family toxin [Herpetosiphonaceae bacterium]